ncbi:IclR family transcriptional regulator [Kribbella solani]|uniref:IclR family transcriptional regulator n=1 Tax=Kribbella solani TaxID=236067 RepID=UPI0029B09D3C|nr:IclR family transcriptional regulator [Kribbella solani]MDX2973353.1 IclR family transcriptional regulator [Kribbella solani]MDX3000823.1 IclR family transcriptional regulator [Kribbella solani]
MSPLTPQAVTKDRVQPGETIEDEGRVYAVRSIERVVSVLNLLQESIDGVTLKEVADAADLPKSSAFRYLWTLEKSRYVERDTDSGLFRIGLGFLGMQSRHTEVLRERVRPSLERLRDDLDETTNLGLLDGHHVIYLEIIESRRSVRLAASRGTHDPLHSTALGKAIAAHLPEDRVRELLSEAGMPSRTAETITSVDDYLAELAKVRRLGYAVDNRENEPDGRCVAVPILGTRLPAALSVSAPEARFSMRDVEKTARTLIEVAGQITLSPTETA